MVTYGVAVSLPTKSVTSTEPRDFVFNSQYDTFKIFAQGTGTLTVSAGSENSVSIAHGLSFVPLVLFWCQLKPSSGKWFFGAPKFNPGDADAGDCYPEIYLSGGGPIDYGATYVDATNFRLTIFNEGGSSQAVQYKYVFFGDTSEA